MEGTLKTLIEAVEGELVKRQWDFMTFSNYLGINKSNWSLVRNGKRPPSWNLLALLKQKLPEVSKYVDDYRDHRKVPIRQVNDHTSQKGKEEKGASIN